MVESMVNRVIGRRMTKGQQADTLEPTRRLPAGLDPVGLLQEIFRR